MTTAARLIDNAITAEQTEQFGPDDASARAAISAAAKVRAMADQRLTDTINHQRNMGATWQEIGDALGTTRQSAHERFGKTSAGTGAGDEENEMGTE